MRSSHQALLTLLYHARSLDEDRLMVVACLMRSQLLTDDEPFYEVLMVHGRPWSFSLHHDLGKLADAGWLSLHDGLVAAGPLLKQSTSAQRASWALAGTLPRWWRSVQRLSPATLRTQCPKPGPGVGAQRGRRATAATPTVMTAGYQGLSVEAFLGRLLHAGVTLLIDVRANPTARRFGFHRSTLERCCQAVGIRYEHVPELGIGTDKRRDQTTPAQRQQLFRTYAQSVVATHAQALGVVTSWVRDEPAVLVCMEADPMDCHRTHLGRLISATLDRALIDLGTGTT